MKFRKDRQTFLENNVTQAYELTTRVILSHFYIYKTHTTYI